MDKLTLESLRVLLKSNRSYRRFDGSKAISELILRELVGLTCYCSSARNLQPLRYRTVTSAEEREAIFPALKWAGYLSDWDGPAPTERPGAYLVQCLDTSLTANCLCDDGLQLEAITLGAAALGIHCCIIKAFNVQEIISTLHLPEQYKPLYVLALGYPAEKVVLTDTDGTHDADIRYYRTPDSTHVVPKRPAEELIINFKRR
ncbi:nitroreductase family protein [uncultured Duncaniella sp.]|uniref:nitroreductase family protein n=1 Tax=uncultured Duncaniella sp. TaxID=2768039 RepID=UPI0025A9BA98|nr:nitroreductase family protein [uncultured Duncaniella sp.]